MASRQDSGQAGAQSPAAVEERWLIERAREGDHDAFARLMKNHQRRVFRLITNLLRRPEDVEDVAQQVFLKVYQALPRFNFQASFGTWLHRITVNECYDEMRRRRALKTSRQSEVQLGEAADIERMEPAGRAPALDAAGQLEQRQAVEQLLQRLPPQDRLLLTLKEMEGYSLEEISQVTGLNTNTIKIRLFRARRRLADAHRRLRAARESRGSGR